MKGTDEMVLLRYIIIALVAAAILAFFISTATAQAEKNCSFFSANYVWQKIKSLFSAGPLKVWTPDNTGC